MSGWDTGYLHVTGAGTVGTTTIGWRLPASAAAAAHRLGPPPWEPGSYACAAAIHLAIDGLATDYSDAAMVGWQLLDADLTPIVATADRVERAERLLARVRDAHRHVHCLADPPTDAVWPTLRVDCTDGTAWVVHRRGEVCAGPVADLPKRWVELAAATHLTAGPDGWVPVLWL